MSKAPITTLAIGTEADFFARGKSIAALADAGKPLLHEKRVTFEEFAELAQLLTPARIALVAAVRTHSGSIQELADRTKRNRAGVSKDVTALANMGVFIVKEEILPGHGRFKKVSMPPGEMQIVARI